MPTFAFFSLPPSLFSFHRPICLPFPLLPTLLPNLSLPPSLSPTSHNVSPSLALFSPHLSLFFSPSLPPFSVSPDLSLSLPSPISLSLSPSPHLSLQLPWSLSHSPLPHLSLPLSSTPISPSPYPPLSPSFTPPLSHSHLSLPPGSVPSRLSALPKSKQSHVPTSDHATLTLMYVPTIHTCNNCSSWNHTSFSLSRPVTGAVDQFLSSQQPVTHFLTGMSWNLFPKFVKKFAWL